MAQHHAFGIGRSAAGVEKLCRGVFVDVHDVALKDLRAGEKLVVGAVGSPVGLRMRIELNESSDAWDTAAERVDHGKKLAFEKQNLGIGIVHDVTKLGWRETNVQRQ